MSKCYEGWGDTENNRDGDCCCNCKHQLTLTNHPWNKEHKGSFLEQAQTQYGALIWCCGLDRAHSFIMEREHGMCECHTRVVKVG